MRRFLGQLILRPTCSAYLRRRMVSQKDTDRGVREEAKKAVAAMASWGPTGTKMGVMVDGFFSCIASLRFCGVLLFNGFQLAVVYSCSTHFRFLQLTGRLNCSKNRIASEKETWHCCFLNTRNVKQEHNHLKSDRQQTVSERFSGSLWCNSSWDLQIATATLVVQAWIKYQILVGLVVQFLAFWCSWFSSMLLTATVRNWEATRHIAAGWISGEPSCLFFSAIGEWFVTDFGGVPSESTRAEQYTAHSGTALRHSTRSLLFLVSKHIQISPFRSTLDFFRFLHVTCRISQPHFPLTVMAAHGDSHGAAPAQRPGTWWVRPEILGTRCIPVVSVYSTRISHVPGAFFIAIISKNRAEERAQVIRWRHVLPGDTMDSMLRQASPRDPREGTDVSRNLYIHSAFNVYYWLGRFWSHSCW